MSGGFGKCIAVARRAGRLVRKTAAGYYHSVGEHLSVIELTPLTVLSSMIRLLPLYDDIDRTDVKR